MHILSDIPFTLDLPALLKHAHVEEGSDDAKAFAALVEKANAVAKPKVLYAEAFVDGRGDGTVTIGGITFTSRALARNLAEVQRVFPFVLTCGHEMDGVPMPADDFLAPFWWDEIKAALLHAARQHFSAEISRRYRLAKTASMSPGSGDATVWPIEQQRPLFDLLGGVTPQIGVKLTDSCLMIPNKTVSGICFAAEKDFRTCQLCHREVCPGRSAPFDPDLWAEVEHERNAS